MRAFIRLMICLTAGLAVGCQNADLAMDLSEGPPDLSPPQYAVVIQPTMATIGVGEVLQFTANRAVTWRLPDGPQSGTIDATGRYTAPLRPGTYHVLATADPDLSATAQVAVEPTLALVAGRPGGGGTGDGIGAEARFVQPNAVTGDGAGNLYIADQANRNIRRLFLATQEVVTIAGSAGAVGTTDGIGISARFNQPSGLWYDG